MQERVKILVATVGLPYSGKSTWARKFAQDSGAAIVNPDSVRLALHGQRFNELAERLVWGHVHLTVRALFLAGHDLVVVDATNTTVKRRKEWISNNWKTLYMPMNTSYDECRARAMAAGDTEILDVMDRMARQWEVLTPEETVFRPELLEGR